MVAKYRILSREFWFDEKIKQLSREKRTDEIVMIMHSITGPMACRDSNISGIYVIHRESYEDYCGIDLPRTTKAMEYLNKYMPSLLQFDFNNHVIFLKNFFDYQTNYKPGSSVLDSLMDGFEETFKKAPRFWAEFAELHRKQLGRVYLQLAKSNLTPDEKKEKAEFLDRLFELKNEVNDFPTLIISSPCAEKLLLSQKNLSL